MLRACDSSMTRVSTENTAFQFQERAANAPAVFQKPPPACSRRRLCKACSATHEVRCCMMRSQWPGIRIKQCADSTQISAVERLASNSLFKCANLLYCCLHPFFVHAALHHCEYFPSAIVLLQAGINHTLSLFLACSNKLALSTNS